MGPFNNKGGSGNRQFGQSMKKSNKSSAGSRYQQQFGNKNKYQQQHNQTDSSNVDPNKADEAAARRRLRQEQQEIIDVKFGYHRLEDQYQERQQNSRLREERGNTGPGVDKLMQRRGWLFNMAATTVRLCVSHVCCTK